LPTTAATALSQNTITAQQQLCNLLCYHVTLMEEGSAHKMDQQYKKQYTSQVQAVLPVAQQQQMHVNYTRHSLTRSISHIGTAAATTTAAILSSSTKSRLQLLLW